MEPAAADRGPRRGGSLHRPALAVLLLVTFGLRVWGIKQGLPYSYNSDEATHFVPRAIAYFSHDFNPHYFLNPPAYSYLLHIVFELWFGSSDKVSRAYATDPTAVFVVARSSPRSWGRSSVWLTYLAGARFFNRNVGLLAAAILAFAFLPVFYSHLALNDVPTLAPVSLALYGTAGVMRHGRMRDYAIAGAGIGLAAATKYTGGITMLCLLTAFITDASGGLDVAEAGRPAVRAGAARSACSRSWSPTRTRCSTFRRSRPACTRRRRWRRGGPGQARHTARQRHHLLPVDVHLGPGLGPDAGRDRRGDPADRPAAHRDGADVAARDDRVHHLHGRPAALLRPLADADLPDRGDARRLRDGRAGQAGWPAPGGCPP